MEHWERICGILSDIFTANKHRNFNISLSPEEVSTYLQQKVLFARLNSINPDEIEAALFVTIDGECGFIGLNMSTTTYKFLTTEFQNFVITLPEDLRSKLWCRIQKDNHSVLKLVKRYGFELASKSDTSYYFTYKGG